MPGPRLAVCSTLDEYDGEVMVMRIGTRHVTIEPSEDGKSRITMHDDGNQDESGQSIVDRKHAVATAMAWLTS